MAANSGAIAVVDLPRNLAVGELSLAYAHGVTG